jgi:hypothetical protein
MSELTETVEASAPEAPQYLVGIRVREPVMAEDYLTTETGLHVGEFVIVDSGNGTTVGEVRRPQRPLPEFKRGRLYRRVLRRATDAERTEWREVRDREVQGVGTCQRLAWARG